MIFSQGVTLTDLQEAEKTFSRSRAERQAQEQPGEKLEDPGGLEGNTKKQEPSAAPTKEAEEGQQSGGRSLEEEVSSSCWLAMHHKQDNLVYFLNGNLNTGLPCFSRPFLKDTVCL